MSNCLSNNLMGLWPMQFIVLVYESKNSPLYRRDAGRIVVIKYFPLFVILLYKCRHKNAGRTPYQRM